MFSIFRFDPETQEVQNIRQAFDPDTARSSQHQACNRCHEKKLKCSGEKDACNRCVSQGLPCVYSRPESRNAKKGKRSERQSSCSSVSGRDASPSPTSTTASVSSPPTRSRRGRRGPPPRSSASSRPSSLAADVSVASTAETADYITMPSSGLFQMNLSPTTQVQSQGFTATSMPPYSIHSGAVQPLVGDYEGAWILNSTDGSERQEINPYLPESNVIYGSTIEYPESAHYGSYNTNQGPGVDPRFWNQDVCGSITPTVMYNDALA